MANTLREVARTAGVSTATVSRALSPDTAHMVAEPTRRRIQTIADELGFVRSSLPANMRSNRSKVFGIVVSDVENPFFTALTRAAEAEAHAAGYRLILVNTDEDPAKEETALAALASERVAGVILASVGGSSQRAIRPLSNVGVPLVALDNELSGLDIDTVTTNNFESAKSAVELLVDAGHRSIAMISGPERASSIRDRTQAFREACASAGVDARVVEGDLREECARELTAALLRSDSAPTALFCVNNLSTMGALRACREVGCRIPDDVSVLGFDDIPLRDVLVPAQAVVAQPLGAMGRAAARMLLDRIQDPARPAQSLVVDSALLTGESVAPPASHTDHQAPGGSQ